MSDCRLCAAPALWEDKAGLARVIAFPEPQFPGHRVVMTRRHHAGLEEVTVEEWAAFGSLISRLSAEIRREEGAERCYVLAIGDVDDHVCHVHLVPRFADDPPLGPHVFGPGGWNRSRPARS
jgi:diadenosine tetraphosphate (Ap4A) HIT family hydrolase